MTVALCATAIVIVAQLWDVSVPWRERRSERSRARRQARRAGAGPVDALGSVRQLTRRAAAADLAHATGRAGTGRVT